MRWVFLLLVALNIFYFVWTQQQPPSLAGDVVPFALVEGGKARIRLVSEHGNREGEQSPMTASGEICLYLGGFETDQRSSMLEQRLISLDIQAGQAVTNLESSKDYWVYLPPFGSRDAALRQFKELQARGIDSYLITQGDLSNGISLGIFSGQDSAVSLLERIRAMGYGAELRELVRERREHWVRVPARDSVLVGDDLLSRLVQDFPGMRHQMLPCASPIARQ